MSRRAQVFSMIAIMMSILFILIFSSMTHVPLDRKVPIIKAEVSRVDSFVKDFDRLVINAVDRAAYGSLAQFSLLQQEISSVSSTYYFENFTESFESCFEGTTYVYNSAINATPLPCDSSITLPGVGYNFSFSKYVSDLFFLASKTFNVSISYDNVDAELSQQSPFELTIDLSMNVYIERSGYSWNRFIVIQRHVPMNGMAHPIIANRTIQYPPYPIGHNYKIARFNGDQSAVRDFIQNDYYFNDNRSPSVIDLFNGNLPNSTGFPENSPYGIASILPANETFLNRPVYQDNHSSSIEYDFLNQNPYATSSIKRIGGPGIPSDQLLQEIYLIDMGNPSPTYTVS